MKGQLQVRGSAGCEAKAAPGERGFSLIEVLVSLLIMIVVLVAALTMFDRSNRMAKVETSVSDAQQNARYASYQVVREARMAGAGGFPASIGGVQMGVTLSLGTSTYHSATVGRHLLNNMNSSGTAVFVGGTHHVRQGTDVLHVRGIIANAIYDLGTSSFAGNTLVIHSCTKYTDPTNTDITDPCYPNGKNDLSFFASFSTSQPRLFCMADALGNIGVAMLTAYTPGTDPNGLANATLTLDKTNAYANSLNSSGAFSPGLTTPTRGGVLDDFIYFVDDGTSATATCGTANQTASPGPCHPQLAVAQWGSGTAGGCTVSAEDPTACATVTPIADDIEDMQIAYGMDFRAMTCTGSGSSLSCTGSGTFTAPVSDNSLSITDATSFTSIVKTASGSTAPNQDPSEDSSGSGKDEWIGNVATEIAMTTFDYSSDLTLLKSIEIAILAKGTQPDPQYVGLGSKAWSVMDTGAQTVSAQNLLAYHRRLISVRADLRNYGTF
jgi:type II secretory pathway pseudopilin PulG